MQESFQPLVSALLTDSESSVRRVLLECSVARLCVFFGRQKASDVIFSHVITFLNDKNDRHLRGAFFDCLVAVASYIGWHCAPICKPLLQQGEPSCHPRRHSSTHHLCRRGGVFAVAEEWLTLTLLFWVSREGLCDGEEWIAVKAVESMTGLTQLGLLPKATLLELVRDAAAFLVHPNRWLRQAAVGLVCCTGRNLNAVDVQCRLAPILDPYLRYQASSAPVSISSVNPVEPAFKTSGTFSFTFFDR